MMWLVIIGAIIIWVLYHYGRKEKSSPHVSVSEHITWTIDTQEGEKSSPSVSGSEHVDDSDFQRAQALSKLKKSFQPAQDNQQALQKGKVALNEFLVNHAQSPDQAETWFQKLNLPDDLAKRELTLRKELDKSYKNREVQRSKAFAIYLAFEHAKLLLRHQDVEWKNFAGLQKLQVNWKAEEYFDALLVLMHAFQDTFPNSANSDKLSKDIERIFDLWNERNLARNTLYQNLQSLQKAERAAEKHFILIRTLSIYIGATNSIPGTRVGSLVGVKGIFGSTSSF